MPLKTEFDGRTVWSTGITKDILNMQAHLNRLRTLWLETKTDPETRVRKALKDLLDAPED